MPEPLGEGFVLITPDFAGFDAALQAKVTASLASIEKQFAAAGAASGAGAASVGAVGAAAGQAAGVISGKLSPAMEDVARKTKKASDAAKDASTSVTGLQRSFSGLAKLAPFIAAAFSVKLFADFEKAAKEASVVFGAFSDDVIGFAKNLDTQFGLTETTALRFATDFGNALQGIGFSAKTAAAASEVLTTRTADTAAALAKSPQQIATAFNLALEGNARGLKQLGITISALDQQNRAAQLGFKGTVSELTDAQRAAVFYSLILEKTNKFQGQAAATAGTFAGRLRDFKASVGDAAIAVGRSLAPALEAVLTVVGAVVGPLGKLPPALLAFAFAAGTTAIALNFLSASALGTFIATLFTAEGAIGAFVAELVAAEGVAATAGVAFDALLGPFGLIALAVGGLAALFAHLGRNTEEATDRLKELKGEAISTAKGFEQLTHVDLNRLIEDVTTLQALGAGFEGKDITHLLVGDVSQLQGLDLNSILRDLKNIQGTFNDLLNPKLGAAGLGAAADALDALKEAGLGNTEVFHTLQAQFDASVASRKQINAETQRGVDILNEDSAVRQKNAADIQAQTDAIKDLFTVSDQLDKANRSLKEAQEDQAAAQAKVNKLRKEGATQEIAEAKEKLGDATDSLTAALLRQAEAQAALDKLNAPATARELQEGEDAVTEALINERRATKALDDARKALNRTTGRSIDLTGLSLDQLRTTLANARATLAAQRESTKGTKSAQELQDDVVEAEIGLREAKNKTADAQQALLDLQNKGKIKTDEIIHAERELLLAKNAVTKAQEEHNKRQQELDSILAGNTENAKQLAAAQHDLRTTTDRVNDAQHDIADLVARQKDDTATIRGDQQIITNEMREQVKQHAALFAQNADLRQALVSSLLSGLNAVIAAPGGGTLPFSAFPDFLLPAEVDKIFAVLRDNPTQLKDLLQRLGITIPGFAEGGTISRPTLAWIGERFKAESIIPWDQPSRVWDIMAQSLPHMPPIVRQRLEPAIHPTPTISRPTHVNVPYGEIDYERMARAIAKALREEGVGADVDIEVKAAPGMNERQLARKVAREMGRWMHG